MSHKYRRNKGGRARGGLKRRHDQLLNNSREMALNSAPDTLVVVTRKGTVIVTDPQTFPSSAFLSLRRQFESLAVFATLLEPNKLYRTPTDAR